ncbi:M48 family metallopeptidase [Spongiactinospora sp. 9N601]|uniref:M48 family metallopeptidase n=1 Tax=Spongiactinospora sp. 9N601 TaxID=3375149 RepID=UPI0037A182B0
MRGLRAAWAALVVLGLALAGIVAVTTPWRALPPGAPEVAADPARDFTAAEIARSQAFDAALSAPAYLSLALGLVFAVVLVATPFGARVVGRVPGPWWVKAVGGVVALTVVVELLRWPLGVWSETYLREYGLSTQTWLSWSADRLKNTAVSTLLTALMVVVLIALARRFARWWIPAALGAFALTLAASFVYPVVVEPIFNDFRPMQAGRLRDDLLAMAGRDGVPVDDVLVADASRRTTALNAYVSGFGATRRIVVYDTLLKAPENEIELIVAHELGHAERDDVLSGTLIGGLGAAWGVILLYLVTSAGAPRRRAAVPSIADPRAVGLLMGLMSLAAFLSGPGQNLVSRHIEARADVHALDLTRDPGTFVAMQRRLALTNIADLDPDRFEYLLYSSHPTAPQRIAAARSWALRDRVPEP